MNKFLVLFLLFTFSCGNKSGGENEEAKEVKVYYPFSPRMDVDFENGNKNYANIVLNIWRGYQSGNIKGYRKYFADSVSLFFHEKLIEGKTEDALKIYQERRDQLASMQAHVEYWQPVYVKNKNENWVLLWINQEATDRNKKLDSWSMHQVWKFNAQGKIYMLQEFRSAWYW